MKPAAYIVSAVLISMPAWVFSGTIKHMDPTKLADYQAEVLHNYNESIGLPENYAFLNGTPVRALPPVQAAVGGVMIIGAYPSAVFEYGNKRVVPVKNLNEPFDPAVSGDSKNKSAEELDQNILLPLGLSRDKCWITNTVKVFLFKPEHAAQFSALKSPLKGFSTRADFETYAQKSLPWLYREIEMAHPKLIITLGAEVAGIVRGVKGAEARSKLLNYQIGHLKIGQAEYRIVHFAHPGILMRKNPKWVKIHTLGVERLKTEIRDLLQE